MTNLHRVHGPPGTGKTTFLSRQCGLAVERYGPDRVIVASLTKAAAEEVAGRDTGLGKKSVGTLHAHAFRALDYPPLAETKEGIDAWNASSPPMLHLTGGSVLDPEWASPEQVARGSDGEQLLSALMVRRARMEPMPDPSTMLGQFAERWQKFKGETGRLDFTDLIERCLDGDADGPDAEVLMVDEAQDLSALEMALALKWGSAARELVTVGDADQNLYQWRGSHPSAFTDPPAKTERTLAQSYRVPGAVHRYAVHWIERIRNRPPIEYRPRDDAGKVSHRFDVTWRQPDGIRGILAASDEPTMILASCSYMLAPTIQMLRELKIPYHNPYRPANGAWNPMRAAARVRALLRGPGAWTWDDLRRSLEPLDAKKAKIARGIKAHVGGTCAERKLGGGTRAEDVVPVGFLLEMFSEDSAAGGFGGGDLDWWESCLLPRFRSSLELPLAAARAGRIDEAPRVIVGTVHSVKGGEAPRVLVFPDLSLSAFWGEQGPFGRAGGWGTGERDAIIRQFYVAFTRAREELVLLGEASSLAVDFPRS